MAEQKKPEMEKLAKEALEEIGGGNKVWNKIRNMSPAKKAALGAGIAAALTYGGHEAITGGSWTKSILGLNGEQSPAPASVDTLSEDDFVIIPHEAPPSDDSNETTYTVVNDEGKATKIIGRANKGPGGIRRRKKGHGLTGGGK